MKTLKWYSSLVALVCLALALVPSVGRAQAGTPRQGEAEERVVAADGQPSGPRPVSVAPKNGFPGSALVDLVFPPGPEGTEGDREQALSSLLCLATAARDHEGNALLPARLHAFFRGLPGLWICTSRECVALPVDERGGLAGRLYAHDPGPTCTCGARVLPLYTCRDCGSAYLRAYTTASLDKLKKRGAAAAAETGGGFLWSEPGERREDADGGEEGPKPLEPLDLYLPQGKDDALRARNSALTLQFDPRTGRVTVCRPSVLRREMDVRSRTFVFGARGADQDEHHADRDKRLRPGQHASCVCCSAKGYKGSTVMDHGRHRRDA